MATHMDSLLRSADVFVTEVSGVDEATESILKTCPHSNALTGTAAIIKVLPHLQTKEDRALEVHVY